MPARVRRPGFKRSRGRDSVFSPSRVGLNDYMEKFSQTGRIFVAAAILDAVEGARPAARIGPAGFSNDIRAIGGLSAGRDARATAAITRFKIGRASCRER